MIHSPRGRLAAPLLPTIYFAFVAAPLLLAAYTDTPRTPAEELGAATGMLGFAMLLAQFVLSARFHSLSGVLGIDLALRLHQGLALVLLALLLVHPFLYDSAYEALARRPGGAQAFAAGPLAGVLAWLLLIALSAAALAREHLPWRYETWRLTHGLGAAAVAALGLYHALAIGRYSADPLLLPFWTAAVAAALFALLYVYLLRPLLAGRRRAYRVDAVQPVAHRTWLLKAQPRHGVGLRYRAGQFAWVKFGRRVGNLVELPFSFASAPDADGSALWFLIKEAGDFTATIGRVAPGTPLHLDGPHGTFTLQGRHGRGIALIAGGIGIAPIVGLLRELAARGERRPLVLIYGNRAREQIVPLAQLLPLEALPQLRIHHVLAEPPPGWTGEVGAIDAPLLARLLPAEERAQWLYFVCGPAAMIDAVETALVRAGVPLQQIVAERLRYVLWDASPRGRRLLRVLAAVTAALLAAAIAFAWRGAAP
ncbi:MAG: ferric reductase-like transmembrane domain-containing protein [Burkholderiaceae bacterium]|nr:ferric reductase-like transmembrane domain-containing protein [Burkholderiaceae bacterium]